MPRLICRQKPPAAPCVGRCPGENSLRRSEDHGRRL